MPRMSDANQKKELAQKARLEREAAEQSDRQRKQRFKLLGAAAGVIVVIVLVVVLAGAFKSDPTKNASSSKVTVGGETVTIKGKPETEALIKGLQQKGTVLGDPNAPASIVEIGDLKCPSCQSHEVTSQAEIVNALVRTGKANLDMQLVNFRDQAAGTTDGAVAMRVANNLATQNKFWNFVHTLYYNQGSEQDQWATDKRLGQIAAGSPGLTANAINTRETPASRTAAADALKLSQVLKVQGTPSIYVKPRGVGTYTSVPNYGSLSDITKAVDDASKKATSAKATR